MVIVAIIGMLKCGTVFVLSESAGMRRDVAARDQRLPGRHGRLMECLAEWTGLF
jgi:hypothetical protein